MSETVKRWKFDGTGPHTWAYRSGDGEYVLYADYAKLEARNAQLEHWMHGYKTPEESMHAMQSSIAKLAADNKALVEALNWARPYVSRLRDTEIIDEALKHHGGAE